MKDSSKATREFVNLSRVATYPDLFEHPDVLADLLRDCHTGVGRAIIESWGFSEAIAEAVDEHELHDREHHGNADLTDVVMVANLLSRIGEADQPSLATVAACRKLRIDEPGCKRLVSDADAEIRSMTASLGG